MKDNKNNEFGIQLELSESIRLNQMRYVLLIFLVHLFAQAESAVRRKETRETCNHWWHRDLLNEAVVQLLLQDPHFYRTSMRDDPAS